MRVMSYIIACTMFLFPGAMSHQTSSQVSSVETLKQDLLELENHWLQVENDPDALEGILAPDFLQTGTEELKAPDVHAGVKKRLGQTASVEHLHYRWLEKGATRLAMRREPALDNARLDAMAKKLARRE